ncbi:hypothetical protein [Desmospora profundinema]|uniref:Uncharacterized protein n=1 Tax=Desmospora profundinema TaxID=1571184 RepID=A0ABU1IK53_9BACL|nr:hypothetical protein [Desmospora profundinema]MDR6225151.1 hypothetical protein [Desmospora profundinema]
MYPVFGWMQQSVYPCHYWHFTQFTYWYGPNPDPPLPGEIGPPMAPDIDLPPVEIGPPIPPGVTVPPGGFGPPVVPGVTLPSAAIGP